jgi:PKD repeat protein
MAIIANFTADVRVGEGQLLVTFTDASTGSIISRKWIFGDGDVQDGNDTVVTHTYSDGKFDVTLVVFDGVDQTYETKTEHIIVDRIYAPQSFMVMDSQGVSDGEYWRLYFDADGKLTFEDKGYIYKSVDRVLSIGEWMLIEFHQGVNEMYVGTYSSVRQKIGSITLVNTSPITLTENIIRVAPDTNARLDDLKIWTKEVDLTAYYYETRGRAGLLNGSA